jgi:hypothetical protein
VCVCVCVCVCVFVCVFVHMTKLQVWASASSRLVSDRALNASEI